MEAPPRAPRQAPPAPAGGFAIRPATAADREALLEQTLSLNRFEHAIAGDRRTDLEGARESLGAVLAHAAETGGHVLVAEAAGTAAIIAHMVLCFERHPPFVAERDHGLVADLFVREPWRGQGIGRALLAEAERLTRARGLGRLLIGLVAGNHGAEATYRRAGFAPYSQTMIRRLG